MSKNDKLSLLYLWEFRTLYIGSISDLSTINQGASSLIFGIEGSIDFWTESNTQKISTRSALVPAGFQINADACGKTVAVCYLDPLGRDFASLRGMMAQEHEGIMYESNEEGSQIEGLLNIQNNIISAPEAYQILTKEILSSSNLSKEKTKNESLIMEVINQIKKDPLTNHCNAELADTIGISKDQLQRRFKRITGIPIRRYRLWYRLFITATLMAQGSSLTDAALQTGFSDSAHFNHTFRSMLGMRPSFILQQKNGIKILSGGDEFEFQ